MTIVVILYDLHTLEFACVANCFYTQTIINIMTAFNSTHNNLVLNPDLTCTRLVIDEFFSHCQKFLYHQRAGSGLTSNIVIHVGNKGY